MIYINQPVQRKTVISSKLKKNQFNNRLVDFGEPSHPLLSVASALDLKASCRVRCTLSIPLWGLVGSVPLGDTMSSSS